jgi:GNAT superfamily N-acetyltransferase
VHEAALSDTAAVAEAIHEMLLELGGSSPPVAELREATRVFLEDEHAGVLLLAETPDGRLIGVLGASWQVAVRVPGPYALIQELWVSPQWRGRTVGADLLEDVCALVRERGMRRVEVGLPSERFAGLAATEAFYLGNDFAPIGTRMRRLL